MCTKTGLIRALKTYYANHEEAKLANYSVYDTIPTSFILVSRVEDNESQQFASRWKEISSQNFQKESVPAKHCEENMWLVKPANLNQGYSLLIYLMRFLFLLFKILVIFFSHLCFELTITIQEEE